MKETFEKPLIELLEKQGRNPADVKTVQKAYDFAHEAHDGQLRKSNDPYIIHPVGVAEILAKLESDVPTLCSALLHDVLEDCDVTNVQMEEAFGKDIVTIVEGVTKLGKFSFSSKEERQAENFRKLIVAIAEDFRVVLVKMADRLHNMRTLSHMLPHKQVEISKETLEIYAPLANRFGLGEMKWELEDLALKYVHQDEFQRLQKLVIDTREEREELIQEVISNLEEEIKHKGINANISGRPKHLFGIWLKMKKQAKTFEELYDVLGIRIIIDSTGDKNFCEIGKDPDTQRCYEVMGIVHALFTPIPGRFKDYIAMPKFNNYQSLHTAVIGPKGKPVEIQIRTKRMDHVAVYGIAAHWRYKEGGSDNADNTTDKKLAWLRQLVDWRQDLADAQEYMEEVKIDLFSDQVFVFSPRGDVIDLPTGSTPIDFAYRIHTAVGHKCAGAKINDRIMPLNTVLKNGDIVEIITTKVLQPKMDWLNFAKTHGAKSKIRQWFKKHHREEHIAQGRQMLEAELGKQSLDEFLKTDERIKDVGKKLNIKNPDDMLAAVGYGDITVAQIAHKLREYEKQKEIEKKGYMLPTPQEVKPRDVGGLGGLLHHLAKCCQPVPGEEIAGVVTRGSGIAVHRIDCPNLLKADEGRRMSVDWSQERSTSYPACLKVECLDRVGIAGDILKKVSDNKVNLKDLRVETKKDKKSAIIMLILEVNHIEQLTQVSRAISQISDVLRVIRKDHRKRSQAKTKAQKRSDNVTPIRKKRAQAND